MILKIAKPSSKTNVIYIYKIHKFVRGTLYRNLINQAIKANMVMHIGFVNLYTTVTIDDDIFN